MIALHSTMVVTAIFADDPLPIFSKAEMLFAHLKSAEYEFNDQCQAMMLLAKLPPFMDIIAQMFTQVKDTSGKPKDPSIAEISKAAVLSWDQCHLTGKGNSWCRSTRSVLSSTRVSRTLLSSSSGSSCKPQQSTDAGGEKKKSCCGKKGKGKLQDHAHLTSAIFFSPTMIADMPAAVDPCLYAHQLPQLYQGQKGPAFDSRIKEVFSLVDWLGITPSCETICTLDMCISAPIGETTLFLMDNDVISQTNPSPSSTLHNNSASLAHASGNSVHLEFNYVTLLVSSFQYVYIHTSSVLQIL